jgi:hypothetical protein
MRIGKGHTLPAGNSPLPASLRENPFARGEKALPPGAQPNQVECREREKTCLKGGKKPGRVASPPGLGILPAKDTLAKFGGYLEAMTGVSGCSGRIVKLERSVEGIPIAHDLRSIVARPAPANPSAMEPAASLAGPAVGLQLQPFPAGSFYGFGDHGKMRLRRDMRSDMLADAMGRNLGKGREK